MPDLPAEDLAHVLRGMWDRAGFVGPNNGGYPVASLLAPLPLADDIADVIRAVTGKRSPARPLHRMYWVGVSGHACAAWLRYLYGSATVSSPHKLEQARALMNLGAGSVPYSAGREG
jgi:hypothetical protein